jgi:hypothetical protein
MAPEFEFKDVQPLHVASAPPDADYLLSLNAKPVNAAQEEESKEAKPQEENDCEQHSAFEPF